MKPEEFSKPTVPVGYVLLTLEQARDRGLPREEILKGLNLPDAVFDDPEARIPLLAYGNIVARTLRLSADGGLGYDFGLRNSITAHGLLGLGLMSQPTVRELVDFSVKYVVKLRSPGFSTRFFVDGDQAVVDVREAVPYGPLRQYAFDMLLAGLAQTHRQLLPDTPLELWFECTEPPYYARYRERLPKVRFAMGANQMRFPAAILDRRVETGDAATARLLVAQAERDVRMLGAGEDFLGRVRALLAGIEGAYPDLEATAQRLHMSPRSLNRKLREHGSSFQELMDEARRRDSVSLLQRTSLTVEEVAARLGYSDAAAFSRAFRKWHGLAPGRFRERHAGPN
jgi:AraC-like DNA-binding protein